jgi:hypothetical protein
LHLPSLVVCPRIVIRLGRLEGRFRRDEHVDIACRSFLNSRYISDFLGTQRFLRIRLIDIATNLDMEEVLHIRIEGFYRTGVIVSGFQRLVF